MSFLLLRVLSKNHTIRNTLGMRPCQNLLENKLAAKYKIVLETSTLIVDTTIASTIITGIIADVNMKNEPRDEYSIMMFSAPLIAGATAASCCSFPILCLTSIRAYRAWKLNTLTITTNRLFHMIF